MKIPTASDGIAWVTGASSGIGREVAAQLARAGWTVAISARRADQLESLAALHPGRMIVMPLDVTQAEAIAPALARIEAQAGRPVVRAVFSAGTYVRDNAKNFDVANFKLQVDVNLIGLAGCLAALMPGMMAARRGQIGIIGSVAGLSGLPEAVSYSATKAALISMAQSLKFDLDRAQVGISMILPGFVKTPLTDKNDFPMPFIMTAEAAAAEILKGMAQGRFIIAFPAQLAWPLRFLRLLPSELYFPLMKRATKP